MQAVFDDDQPLEPLLAAAPASISVHDTLEATVDAAVALATS